MRCAEIKCNVVKSIWTLILLGICYSCNFETVVRRDSISAGKTYSYIEPDLEQLMILFKNSIKLDQYIFKNEIKKKNEYFSGESIFYDCKKWWGVKNRTRTYFKLHPLNDKSLTSQGAKWIACSEYYSHDSIVVECTESGHWLLKGYTQGDDNWRTQLNMEITCPTEEFVINCDSVHFYIDVKGVSSFTRLYPPVSDEICFNTIQPLLHVNTNFVAGLMKLETKDIYSERKNQMLAQIEFLNSGKCKVCVITSK